jgi:hypothetical protein
VAGGGWRVEGGGWRVEAWKLHPAFNFKTKNQLYIKTAPSCEYSGRVCVIMRSTSCSARCEVSGVLDSFLPVEFKQEKQREGKSIDFTRWKKIRQRKG